MDNEEVKKVSCDPQLSQSVTKNINELRKRGKHCDFILKTEDGGIWNVHKSILEAASPFFKKMFNSEFQDKNTEFLLLVKVSSLVLDRIIGFMYTGEIEISENIAKETLDYALFLELTSLVDLCTGFLIKTATKDNCIQLLEYSKTYCGQNLSTKCTEIIHQNIETFVESPELIEMSPEAMEMLVSYDPLQERKEKQLYLAVTKWIEYDIEERKQYLKTLFDKIKFERISKEFAVSKILQNNPLLRLKEFQDRLADIFSVVETDKMEKGKENKHIFRPPTMFSVVDCEIRQYNPERTSFDCITKLRENKMDFADTTFGGENYFICGGRSVKTGTNLNICEYFNIREKKWNDLPPIIESRVHHRSVTLDNKIFVCGGIYKSSVEIFDICKSFWYKGASLSQEMFGFGLCTLDNCIFAVEQDNFERYDPRSGSWTQLPSLNFGKFFHAIGHGNFIRGFNSDWICTFDIRNNCWIDKLVNFEDLCGYPCVYDGKLNFVALKNEMFYLETYDLETLLLDESNRIYDLKTDMSLCRLFSIP